jgi:O-antigen/teichoic acid export membrane protein
MVTGMGVSKKTTPMLWIVGSAAVANIGLNLVLIPEWGMLAAAWTTVLGNAIMAGGGWWYSQKSYPIPYDWGRIFRTAAIGSAVVAAVVFLAPSHGLGGWIAGVVASIAFVVALIVTSTVKPEEVTAGREALRRLRARGLPGFRREVPT